MTNDYIIDLLRYGFNGTDFTDAEFVVENKLLEEDFGALVHQLYPVE